MGVYHNTDSDFEFIKECKMYWQGRELIVTNLEISLDRNFETDEMSFRAEAKSPRTFDKIGDDKMDRCETKSDGSYDYTARQIAKLEQTADDKLLAKYRIVRETGELTSDGLEVCTNLWFKDNKEKVVEALKKLETERKENK